MRLRVGVNVVAKSTIASGETPDAVPEGTRGVVLDIKSSIMQGERCLVKFDNGQRIEVGADIVAPV